MMLWRDLTDAELKGFQQWARNEFERDPSQSVNQTWHPVVRLEWAKLMEAKALEQWIATLREGVSEPRPPSKPMPQWTAVIPKEEGAFVKGDDEDG